MKIKNLEGLTLAQVEEEVAQGGKFVFYQYAVSVLVMSFKRPTEIYFLRAGQNAVVPGLGYTLLSAAFGWWGFPWGLIYTPTVLYSNLRGGKDITDEVMHDLRSRFAQPAPEEPTNKFSAKQ
jgi:hypothetical protein